MSDEVIRYRLCLLAFDDPARLWQAIRDLLEHGLEPEQFCLIGLPNVLEALEAPDGPDRQLSAGLAKVLEAPATTLHFDRSGEFMARGSDDMAALLRRPGSTIGTLDWMQKERASELCRHAENGAVILLVRSVTAEQHAHSGGALLRHGRHNLQTHVFVKPASH